MSFTGVNNWPQCTSEENLLVYKSVQMYILYDLVEVVLFARYLPQLLCGQ